MELELAAGEETAALQTDNYYKVQFSAVGFTPAGDLQPCTALQGMRAIVEFVDSSGGKPGQITSVELRK